VAAEKVVHHEDMGPSTIERKSDKVGQMELVESISKDSNVPINKV
jgi:hypothetical protein